MINEWHGIYIHPDEYITINEIRERDAKKRSITDIVESVNPEYTKIPCKKIKALWLDQKEGDLDYKTLVGLYVDCAYVGFISNISHMRYIITGTYDNIFSTRGYTPVLFQDKKQENLGGNYFVFDCFKDLLLWLLEGENEA